MTAMNPTTEHGANPPETDAIPEAAAEPAVSILVGAVSSDRCPVCSAEMAGDQRYCVECGTRRGKPRFELAGGPSRKAAAATVSQPAPSVSSRLTLMLALIVVLVALGIGVLIGNSGSSSGIKGPITVVLSGSSANGAGSGSSKTAGKSNGAAKTAAPPKTSTTSNFFGS
jgi:hypothetical protein